VLSRAFDLIALVLGVDARSERWTRKCRSRRISNTRRPIWYGTFSHYEMLSVSLGFLHCDEEVSIV